MPLGVTTADAGLELAAQVDAFAEPDRPLVDAAYRPSPVALPLLSVRVAVLHRWERPADSRGRHPTRPRPGREQESPSERR